MQHPGRQHPMCLAPAAGRGWELVGTIGVEQDGCLLVPIPRGGVVPSPVCGNFSNV